jgi:hypothetical protein
LIVARASLGVKPGLALLIAYPSLGVGWLRPMEVALELEKWLTGRWWGSRSASSIFRTSRG